MLNKAFYRDVFMSFKVQRHALLLNNAKCPHIYTISPPYPLVSYPQILHLQTEATTDGKYFLKNSESSLRLPWQSSY